jgi:hypothetical protein
MDKSCVALKPAFGRQQRLTSWRLPRHRQRAPPERRQRGTPADRCATLPSTISSVSEVASIKSAATSIAFARTFSAAMRVADPVITVTRAACAPNRDRCGRCGRGPRARSVIDAKRVRADLRDHGLGPLPDRSAPVTTSTAPLVSTVFS